MAAIVTYSFGDGGTQPVFSSLTPPTAPQTSQVQEIVAQVSWLLADVSALVTHNYGFTASQALNFFRPQVVGPVWISGPLGGGTSSPFMSFDFTNTNVLTIRKLGVAGTEGTFVLYLRRPFSASK